MTKGANNGLGPLFNSTQCLSCHSQPNAGGSSPARNRQLEVATLNDGVYMNGWPGLQVCYCENCKKIGDPHSEQYRAALMDGAADLINLYKEVVLEKSPNNFYSCNLGGGLKESGLDQWRLTREALWYTADNQSRSGLAAPIWQDSQQANSPSWRSCAANSFSSRISYCRRYSR